MGWWGVVGIRRDDEWAVVLVARRPGLVLGMIATYLTYPGIQLYAPDVRKDRRRSEAFTVCMLTCMSTLTYLVYD